MIFASDRPYSDPEKSARKLVEIPMASRPCQISWIYIELINGPFLFREKGTPAHCSSSESTPPVINSNSTLAAAIRDPGATQKPC